MQVPASNIALKGPLVLSHDKVKNYKFLTCLRNRINPSRLPLAKGKEEHYQVDREG